MTRDQIREVFLRNGFTVKEGQTDLKDYVYEAAEALLAASALDLSAGQDFAWPRLPGLPNPMMYSPQNGLPMFSGHQMQGYANAYGEAVRAALNDARDAADAALLRKLLRSCSDMGAKKFDDNNEPGQLRIIVDVDNRNTDSLEARMRSMIEGYCSRVGEV